ncbi:MAG: HAMP domain-containing protein [Proteobacteria bacterium]|nr:MAG: HAMP domain-containing protein [Pseudomonadota bacterium]
MNTLFAKIFLWFWMTTITVVVVTAIATTQLNRALGGDPLRAYFQRTQSAYAQAAGSILDTQGLGALGVWLGELQGPGGAPGRLQLLDDVGRAVFGRPPAADIVASLATRGPGVAAPAMVEGVFFDPIYGPDGTRYWFVSDMRLTHPTKAHAGRVLRLSLGRAGIGWFRFCVALLVSGAVCYGLARYLTIPIRRLQAASAEIANGNFTIRIDDARRGDELGDLARDFDRMAEHLERLNASQQQLLRDVSHELRSPLARLQVAVGLARQRSGDAIGAELDRIEHEAQALEELIRQLLSLARIDAGAADLSHEDIPVDGLIDAIVQDANYEGIDGGKRVAVLGTSGAVVVGDRGVLKSALENVVRNALKHTPDDTVVDITVIRDPGGQWVEIVVRDYGPGVSESLIGELFKPFFRVDYARHRDHGGYGIGLAIADAAVRRHGGTIRANNHAEGGLCVEIRLPCH